MLPALAISDCSLSSEVEAIEEVSENNFQIPIFEKSLTSLFYQLLLSSQSKQLLPSPEKGTGQIHVLRSQHGARKVCPGFIIQPTQAHFCSSRGRLPSKARGQCRLELWKEPRPQGVTEGLSEVPSNCSNAKQHREGST